MRGDPTDPANLLSITKLANKSDDETQAERIRAAIQALNFALAKCQVYLVEVEQKLRASKSDNDNELPQ